MRIRVLAVALSGSLLAGGCAAVPQARPELPDGKVAATNEQATRFFNRYDETNNTANAERDVQAITTIEAGPALEASLTGYELATANNAEPPEAYFHTDVSAYSPRFTEYPMWFVATAQINNDPNRTAVLAVMRESASAEWVVEQGGTLGEADLPDIRLEDGAIAEATGEQQGRVAALLEDAYSYLAGGDAPAGADVGAESLSSYRDWAENSTIQLEEVTAPEITCSTDSQAEVRVLPTTDGVLGVATGRCVLSQTLRDDVPGEMTLGGELSALAPEPGRSVEFVSSHPLVVHAPDDGEAVVYAGGWRWADVTISAA
ncbi:MAG TPA: hypothetical protein VFZ85_17425 [Jiangellaceae bacterium]